MLRASSRGAAVPGALPCLEQPSWNRPAAEPGLQKPLDSIDSIDRFPEPCAGDGNKPWIDCPNCRL